MSKFILSGTDANNVATLDFASKADFITAGFTEAEYTNVLAYAPDSQEALDFIDSVEVRIKKQSAVSTSTTPSINANQYSFAPEANVPVRSTVRVQLIGGRMINNVCLYTAIDATGKTLAQNVSLQKAYIETIAKSNDFSAIINADGSVKAGKELWVDLNVNHTVAGKTTFSVTEEQLANYKTVGTKPSAVSGRYLLIHTGSGTRYSFKGLVPERLAQASSNAQVSSVELRARLTTEAAVGLETREASALVDNKLVELNAQTVEKKIAAINVMNIPADTKAAMIAAIVAKFA